MLERPAALYFSWKQFGLWVGLTILGYLIGADFHYNAENLVRPFKAQDLDFSAALVGFFMSAAAGFLMAVFQWNILKAWTPATRIWIPANALAFGLIHAMNDSLPYRPISVLGVLAIGGLIAGLAQAVALRKVLSMPLVWVLLASGTWVAAFLSLFAIQKSVAGDPLAGVVLGQGAAGLITGIVTGLALKFMLTVRTSRVRSHTDSAAAFQGSE
jgi:hypothetical protein